MKTTSQIRDERVDAEQQNAFVGSSAAKEQTVIPVVHEELDIATRRVETDSGVRVVKKVHEREETVDQPLTREDVSVERVAINRYVESSPPVRYEGDTMIVPVLEEVLVVEKRLLLKEEVRVTRRKVEYREPKSVVVRHESASVQRIEESASSMDERDISGSEAQSESLLDERQRQHDELRRRVGPPPSRE